MHRSVIPGSAARAAGVVDRARRAPWVVASTLVVLLGALLAGPGAAQGGGDWDAVELTVHPLRGGVSMITGRGGNIGLSVGKDGAFVVDDQFAPLTARLLETIGEHTEQPVRFVVNTHWHGDHVGGNENLGAAGAVIVAHENVRKRMAAGQFMEAFDNQVPPARPGALPVITFTEAMTFHWNGQTVEVLHVDPAHTDGDALVFWREADVLHMGDTFFHGMYPFIDAGSGGHLAGMLAAADRALALCGEKTLIIPGHGEVATPADLKAYRDMLATLGGRIAKLMAEGKSRDEVIAAKPTADHDADWGGGFMQPDVWVGIVFDGYVAQRGDDAAR